MNQVITRVQATPMQFGEPPRPSIALVRRNLRWRRWRINRPDEPELLTSAELAECTCPDLCHRDHGND